MFSRLYEAHRENDTLLKIFWHNLPFEIIRPFKPAGDHSQSWFLLIDPKVFNVDISIRAQFVEALLKKCDSKQLIHQLAFAKDEGGRVVREYADQSIKAIFNRYLFFCGRYELGELIHQSATSVVLHAVDHSMMADYKAIFNEEAAAEQFSVLEGGKTLMSEDAFIECIRELGLHAHDDDGQVEEQLRIDFKKCDKDASGSIDEDEFVDFCKRHFGESRKVVLKLMKNEVGLNCKLLLILNTRTVAVFR